MATKNIDTIGGLNLFINPLVKADSDPIRAVNVDSQPFGAKSKRGGYIAYLGTPDTAQVNTLFSWTKRNGNLFTYRASGSKLYYSTEGTGSWTVCGNGTITNGNHVGHAVLDDVLIVGDGAGSTRHSTNGTSFTNTTLAPVGEHFAQFQNRIYIGGTADTLFYSTTGDATNWNTSGTSDSSSFTIPGAGKINKVINANDRIVTSKNSGIMFRWDGFNLVDMSTTLGASSPYSVDQQEGYYFWLNRLGVFGYEGVRPKLLSNAIQSEIYNNSGNGIAGGTFDVSSAGVHRYDYFLSAGTITDDLTSEVIDDAIIKYDFQKNEFLNWKFAHFPTAWHSFKDTNGDQQLIFGTGSGQCYQISGTAVSDAGTAIDVSMQFVITLDLPELEKKWNWLQMYFNPGCQAKVSVAFENTYHKQSKKWVELGDCNTGYCEFKLPQGSRSRLMFVRIYEASTTSQFKFYGMYVNALPIQKR